jgi:mRNA interferase RelE/StbE
MALPHHKLMVPDSVLELIRGMHPHLKKKVKESLKQILVNPLAGKALKDELTGLMSFRVSRFRVIYRVSQKKHIEIIAIGPRDRIYEDTFRLIKKEQK